MIETNVADMGSPQPNQQKENETQINKVIEENGTYIIFIKKLIEIKTYIPTFRQTYSYSHSIPKFNIKDLNNLNRPLKYNKIKIVIQILNTKKSLEQGRYNADITELLRKVLTSTLSQTVPLDNKEKKYYKTHYGNPVLPRTKTRLKNKT